ncbi:hypothetical protein C8A01DRAFT_50609 [Parachaetomium inaequale]|uniref:Chitin-binding type-4 domain-containing protein n=1 Tax=Parachaetomium inaequale TaxID=2588326 RepID=A0AAN6P6G8_9PEZI|nr:hypothetical protein C8A01DRAFT_50609 [Parachaetomium inaequale]
MAATLVRLITVAAAAAGVLGHAVVKVPTPRGSGSAYTERCGETYAVYMEKDKAGPIENGVKQAGSALGCNAFLCRGYQYEDNTATDYTAGQVIDFHVDLIAGHHPGYANVSVVDLATNKVIGDPLRSWDDYPNATATTPRSDINFNVTIPSTLGEACSTGGKCAIQWYWYASGNKQTYESCVDFYVTA